MLRRNSKILELYKRDGPVCWICGLPIDWLILQGAKKLTRAKDLGNNSLAPSLDHVKPRSMGGTRVPENLKLSHRCCNVRRADKELTDDIRGWCRRTVERLKSLERIGMASKGWGDCNRGG